MQLSHTAGGRLTRAMALTVLLLPRPAAGDQLRDARIDVAFTASRQCEVSATFTVEVDGRADIEHRLLTLDDVAVTLRGVEGAARVTGPPGASGNSRPLILSVDSAGAHEYTLRYQVVQPEAGAYRCPLWLPTTPTDGRSLPVAIAVTLPGGAEAGGGSLPAFAWEAGLGQARVGHVPAFIRVPFRAAGESAGAGPLNVTRLMDLVAITVLACGTALFAWRRRRR